MHSVHKTENPKLFAFFIKNKITSILKVPCYFKVRFGDFSQFFVQVCRINY